MSRVSLTVHKKSGKIEVSADLVAGWRKFEKWWGFDESCSQPFGDDLIGCSPLKMVLWSRNPIYAKLRSRPSDAPQRTYRRDQH
jgi:hypothetical protein